jgi:mannosyltransferase
LRVAQFGRGYAFVVLITAAASLALLIAVQDRRPWAWWVWAVLLATAAYFHTFALLVVGAHLLAVALLPERPTTRKMALPLALYAVLVAPLVLFIATRSSDQVFWIPRTTPTGVENLGISLVGAAGRAPLAVAAVAALIAAVSLLRRHGADGWAGWFLVLWLVVPLVVGIGVSLVKPLLVDVYFSIALPPLALILAAGVTAVRPRVIGAVLLVGLLLLGARSTYRQFTAGSVQDWHGADNFLLQHAEAGDAFAVEIPDEREGVEYYVDRSRAALPRPTPCYPSDPWGHALPVSGRRPAGAQAALLQCAHGAPHLWVIEKHGDASIQTPLRLTGWQRARTYGFVGIDVEEFAPARG